MNVTEEMNKHLTLSIECDPEKCPYSIVEASMELENGSAQCFTKMNAVVSAVHKIARDFKLTGVIQVTIYSVWGSDLITFSLGTNIPRVLVHGWKFTTITLYPPLPIGEYSTVPLYAHPIEDWGVKTDG